MYRTCTDSTRNKTRLRPKTVWTFFLLCLIEATLTGLEPATTGSTVQYSNQLSYSAVDSSFPTWIRETEIISTSRWSATSFLWEISASSAFFWFCKWEFWAQIGYPPRPFNTLWIKFGRRECKSNPVPLWLSIAIIRLRCPFANDPVAYHLADKYRRWPLLVSRMTGLPMKDLILDKSAIFHLPCQCPLTSGPKREPQRVSFLVITELCLCPMAIGGTCFFDRWRDSVEWPDLTWSIGTRI